MTVWNVADVEAMVEVTALETEDVEEEGNSVAGEGWTRWGCSW